MDYLVLEIHDLGLKLWHDQKLVHCSPGYALLENQTLYFGEKAQKQAQIQPQNIHNKFWSRLDTEALGQKFGQMRHCADIAYEHLLHLAEQTGGGDIIIAIPGHYSKEQLSLLLGIFAESQFRIVGLIDNCLAQALPLLDNNAIYLDIQLHTISIMQLQHIDKLWHSKQITNLPDLGWAIIQENLCRTIAETFIAQTRFDPLKDSSSEQELYNQLKQHLELMRETAAINIESSGHMARIQAQSLAASCQYIYQTIERALPPQNSTMYCSPLLPLLPGFDEAFPQSISINQGSLATTIAANDSLIITSDQDLSLTRSLPGLTKVATTAKNNQQIATHILYENIAYPLLENTSWLSISTSDLKISADATTESTIAIQYLNGELQLQKEKNCQVKINGKITLPGNKLETGDIIEWHERKISLITVQENNDS